MSSSPDTKIDINPLSGRAVMVMVAHPDDETIGAGGTLAKARHLTLVHVTDGAESLFKSILKGHITRAGYARARRAELHRALALLPLQPHFEMLGLRDQRAALHIADMAASLRLLIAKHKPEIILTHAFEGGHPDHDATAMAVHLACRNIENPIQIYEMAGYHRATGQDVYGQFLPDRRTQPIRIPMTQETRARKTAMLACFASQRSVTARFPLEAESFRPVPAYDFLQRPHAGPLYYEAHRLGLTWDDWRALAEHALSA